MIYIATFGVACLVSWLLVHVTYCEIHLREIKAELRNFKFKATVTVDDPRSDK